MNRPYLKFSILYIFLMIILFTMASFNVFYGLNKFPIFSWDEARHGVNAFEMLKKGNFIISTYRNKIDYWNLKPPLSFWATIAGYKISGFNPLGLRMFSAIFAMLTIIEVSLFVNKIYGKLATLISTVSLTTCTQFLINHSARTGDADSLFVFFFTSAILALLLSELNIKWLYVSGLAFSFAFLTKSWHAGNIALIMCLYLIFTGMYKELYLKNWFLLSLCMFVPILIWGGIRFQYDGIHFFKYMVTYDLLQRSSTSIEGHLGGWGYYFKILWTFFSLWIILLFVLAALNMKNVFPLRIKIDRYLIGIILWVITPLLLFTLAETKIRWYILPIYPALSIFIGLLAGKILRKGKLAVRFVLILTILLISMNYEFQIQAYIQHPIPKYHLALLQTIQGNPKFKGYHLYRFGYSKNMKWPQNTVLAAELYDNLQVEDGGYQDFLKSNKALLLVKNGQHNKRFIKLSHLKVISHNNWGYLVSKGK
ncbi:MAG: glycosyltransferase family 39 protein [Bacillota bacterium]|nr:glycosyltransferase family 39 protein [Bacillota bacterium]